jgi:hypothetical protein
MKQVPDQHPTNGATIHHVAASDLCTPSPATLPDSLQVTVDKTISKQAHILKVACAVHLISLQSSLRYGHSTAVKLHDCCMHQLQHQKQPLLQ